MKILILVSRFPFPPIGGDKTHVYFLLKYLMKKHEVTLLSFADRKIDPGVIDKYRDCFTDLEIVQLPKIRSYINCLYYFFRNRPLQVSYYYNSRMKKTFDRKMSEKKFDLIFVHLIRMAEYVKDAAVPKILDMGDAQSLNYLRSKAHFAGVWSMVMNAENIMVKKYEQNIWKHFDITTVVSPIDAQYLRQMDRAINVEVMPIGLDTRAFPFKVSNHSNKTLCFIGNMRTFPNTDAVTWFCHEILPIVKEKYPDIKFYIIGAEPSPKVRELAALSGVHITGKVDDIAQYVYDASVMVAPMRVGAGIQTKIYEAMALGTPVVTTSIGLEGLEAMPGKDLLVADTPDDFAAETIKLIEDKALRGRIANNARRRVEEKYQYDILLKKLERIMDDALSATRLKTARSQP